MTTFSGAMSTVRIAFPELFVGEPPILSSCHAGAIVYLRDICEGDLERKPFERLDYNDTIGWMGEKDSFQSDHAVRCYWITRCPNEKVSVRPALRGHARNAKGQTVGEAIVEHKLRPDNLKLLVSVETRTGEVYPIVRILKVNNTEALASWLETKTRRVWRQIEPVSSMHHFGAACGPMKVEDLFQLRELCSVLGLAWDNPRPLETPWSTVNLLDLTADFTVKRVCPELLDFVVQRQTRAREWGEVVKESAMFMFNRDWVLLGSVAPSERLDQAAGHPVFQRGKSTRFVVTVRRCTGTYLSYDDFNERTIHVVPNGKDLLGCLKPRLV